MAQQTIFYSWQSWTDAGTNRNFIEDCLERAIKEIRRDDSLRLDPVIDRDTQGVPGAADIANTIFDKVADADVFVADVSFVQESAVQRPTPNPNVLVELGYALAKLGEGKVVCVHNLATGQVEDLPFDIRGRAVATYELLPKGVSDEATWQALRAEQRKQLVGKLKNSILAILSSPDPAISAFVNEMVEKLILVIIYGGEVDDRPVKPGCEIMRAILEETAGHFRVMGCKAEANELRLSARLEEISGAIEEAINTSKYLCRGNFEQYVGSVKCAVELATSLKNEWLDSRPLDRDNLNAVHKRLYEMRRQLDALASRLPDLLRLPDGYDEAQQIANPLGLDLCRYAQFGLDRIQPGLALHLSEIGRQLHLVGVSREYIGGSRGRLKASEVLERLANEFGKVVDSLPRPR